MSISFESETDFVERRGGGPGEPAGRERRQFTNSHDELSPAARELALSIDHYKLQHRRRFITCEEMLHILSTLGYVKQTGESSTPAPREATSPR